MRRLNHLHRLSQLTLVMACVAFATACSSSTDARRSQTSDGPSPGTPKPPTLGRVSDRCGAPQSDVPLIRFASDDAVKLVGFEVGRGDVGVVLGHQYPSDLCDWWPYAASNSSIGLRLLAFDFRCYGDSACPGGVESEELLRDISAAAIRLRVLGAQRIFYMGASMGGTLAFAAGGNLSNLFDGVINLSGGGDFADVVGSRYVDAPEFAPRVRVPLLSIVARDDPNISVAEARREIEAVPGQDKRLVVLPGSAHGVMLFTTGADEATRVDRIVRGWISERL